MSEEFTENELATINEILKMQAGASMTPEEDFGNRMLTAEGEAMTPEEKEFLARILGLNSGAELSPEEIRQGKQQFFEMPGDPPEVLQDKALLRQMMLENSGAAMSPEEMPPVQPQNFGEPPKQGALPMAPDMSTEQGKAAYLQQAIDNIKSRTFGQTGSQRLANLATGALPKQAGSAMTPEEMQQLRMMKG